MLVKSLATADSYQAPNHRLIESVRLLGFEPKGPDTFWVGHSTVLPGGGAGPDSSPIEKVYVVLSGVLMVRTPFKTHTLCALDACRIAPHEIRELINESNDIATLLVIMPYPPT